EATPTTRVTRRRTLITRDASQQKNSEEQSKALSEPASLPRRESKRSKCGLTDSTHEADVSDSESCCSVGSGILAIVGTKLTPRTSRRAAAHERTVASAKQEESEKDSCSSALVGKTSRAKRSQKKLTESTTSQDNCPSEAESCSSVASLSKVMETQMITRSRRKTAVPPKEANPLEADLSSAVSGPEGSTVRRSTRNRRVRPTEPIPIHLDQGETTKASVSSGSSGTLRSRDEARPADENQPYDSEGCTSGPSMSPWRLTRSKAYVCDSDLESVVTGYSSVDSPCSLRRKGTPYSSRNGSASSRTRSKMRVPDDVLDAPPVASEHVDMESKKSEGDETDTPVDVPFHPASLAVSDGEDVEDTEDEEANKAVSANQEHLISEDTKGHNAERFDRGDTVGSSTGAEVGASESRQECVEENHSTERQEKNENDGVTEDCEKFAGTQPQLQSSQSAEILKVLNEPVERMEMAEDKMELLAQDIASGVDQDLSELAENSERNSEEVAEVLGELVAQKTHADHTVIHSDTAGQKLENEEQETEVEQHMGMDSSADAVSHKSEDRTNDEDPGPAQTAAEEPSCSSDTQNLKTAPVKGRPSLLDSSEDESDEEDAGHYDSEAEEVCFDKNQPGTSGEADPPHNNGLFVIDTHPGFQPCEKYYLEGTPHKEDDHTDLKAHDEEEFVDDEGDDDDEDDEDSQALFTTRKPAVTELSSSIDPGLKVKQLGGLYISFDGSKSKSVSNNLKKLKDQKNQEQLLKKSVIVADFEKKDTVPPYKESKRAAKLKRKEEKAKTTGEGWFNMQAPELTEELRNDLKALQMRSAMDPKRFYKKNDREGLPKYFQVGTVVDSPADFYHSRIPKKQRKRTIMEELLADAEFRSYNKKKYQEIMVEKAAEAAGRMNRKKHKVNKKK
ncbi:hypothetical protein P4O66_022883, partial [Electrophorus voltai]